MSQAIPLVNEYELRARSQQQLKSVDSGSPPSFAGKAIFFLQPATPCLHSREDLRTRKLYVHVYNYGLAGISLNKTTARYEICEC